MEARRQARYKQGRDLGDRQGVAQDVALRLVGDLAVLVKDKQHRHILLLAGTQLDHSHLVRLDGIVLKHKVAPCLEGARGGARLVKVLVERLSRALDPVLGLCVFFADAPAQRSMYFRAPYVPAAGGRPLHARRDVHDSVAAANAHQRQAERDVALARAREARMQNGRLQQGLKGGVCGQLYLKQNTNTTRATHLPLA